MKNKLFLALLSTGLFLFSCKKEVVEDLSTTTSPASKDADLAVVTSTTTTINSTLLLQLVNDMRKTGCNCGTTAMPPVPALAWNSLLQKAAQNHSNDMSTKKFFSHTGSNGSNPGQRLTQVGYIWRTYGENIAWGYQDERAVITGWLKSSGHCKNIMNANFKDLGVARTGTYWTMDLGTRR